MRAGSSRARTVSDAMVQLVLGATTSAASSTRRTMASRSSRARASSRTTRSPRATRSRPSCCSASAISPATTTIARRGVARRDAGRAARAISNRLRPRARRGGARGARRDGGRARWGARRARLRGARARDVASQYLPSLVLAGGGDANADAAGFDPAAPRSRARSAARRPRTYVADTSVMRPSPTRAALGQQLERAAGGLGR